MYKKGIKMENTNVEQMKMQTKNLADEKLEALKELFPNAVTEVIDENGEETVAIDKDILMQEISAKVVEGNEERYQFTWPDKKKINTCCKCTDNENAPPVQRRKRKLRHYGKSLHRRRQPRSIETLARNVLRENKNDIHRSSLQYRKRFCI